MLQVQDDCVRVLLVLDGSREGLLNIKVVENGNKVVLFVGITTDIYRFLAHLSRRLKGEFIVYQSSCRLCVCMSVCKYFQT